MRSRLVHVLTVSVLALAWVGAAAAYYEAATACAAMSARGSTCCEMAKRDRVGTPRADCCKSVAAQQGATADRVPPPSQTYASAALPVPVPAVMDAPVQSAVVHSTAQQRAPPHLIFIDTIVLLI